MPKITKRMVDSLAPKPEGDVVVWDAELKGFGIRVKPSGAGSYCLQYRTKHGRSRRLTFGRVGVITPEQARNEARRLLIKIHEGADPAADRQEARKAITVADLCQEHLEAARAGLVLTRRRQRKASSTISNEVGWIDRHVLPLIGAIPANELTRPIVQKMHDAIVSGQTAGDFKTRARGRALVKGGATVAARVVEMLGGIWTWGEKRGLVVGPNPANGIQKHKPEPRDRTLDADELKRLGVALREHEKTQPAAASALRLIALTGLRREEACGLRWREIDAAVQALRLEATKTGRSMRPIGKVALDVLADVPRSSEFVFPSRDRNSERRFEKENREHFRCSRAGRCALSRPAPHVWQHSR